MQFGRQLIAALQLLDPVLGTGEQVSRPKQFDCRIADIRRQRPAICDLPRHSFWHSVAVHNSITVKPQLSAIEVKEKVLAALYRQATEDAKSIHIETSGGAVTLTGRAFS